MTYTDTQLKDMALGEALTNFLSGWDESMSNTETLDAVAREDWDAVSPWDAVERLEGKHLAGIIQSCADGIYRLLKTVSGA